jgi:hypothetical protein
VIRETFFNYKGFRWLWVNLAFLAAVIVLYVFFAPVGGNNGGTWLGYTLGALATAGILYLMWYGKRKRSYHAADTTLKGCLAAHVWIGIMLLILVPLHAGFQFGVNVHTLAYVLMSVVVISGIWGAMNYSSLASQIGSHRGGGSLKSLLGQIQMLASDLDGICKGKSDAFVRMASALDFQFAPSYWRLLLSRGSKQVNRKKASELLAQTPEAEREEGLKVISLINRKAEIVNRTQSEIKIFFWLRLWLYFHLPVSCALLVALAIHIFAVFFMW